MSRFALLSLILFACADPPSRNNDTGTTNPPPVTSNGHDWPSFNFDAVRSGAFDASTGNYLDDVNPEAMRVIQAYLEPSLASCTIGFPESPPMRTCGSSGSSPRNSTFICSAVRLPPP